MRNMLAVSPKKSTLSDLLPCHLPHIQDLLMISLLIRTYSWTNAKKIGFLFERQPGTTSASHRKHISMLSFNQRWRVRKVITVDAFRRSPITGDSTSLSYPWSLKEKQWNKITGEAFNKNKHSVLMHTFSLNENMACFLSSTDYYHRWKLGKVFPSKLIKEIV